jgi:sortase A
MKEVAPMNKKTITLFLVVCVSFISIGFYIFYPKDKALVIGAVDTSSIALPDKIIIPSININASIEEVGITTEGQMDTPKVDGNVGWYEFGPVPGAFGSAVIAGHLDTSFGAHGVFWNLDKVKIGDDIFVIDKYGTKLIFVVTKIKLFPFDLLDTKEIFDDNQNESLNLITCNGSWENSVNNYSQRLVVFSVLKK